MDFLCWNQSTFRLKSEWIDWFYAYSYFRFH